MRFEDERYVRLYTRDTTTWLMLRWEGQTVFALLLRKVDRAGIFDLSGCDPFEAVSAVTQIPEEIVRVGLKRLLDSKVLEMGDDCIVVPKFIEAQETSMSPGARQKEHRLRARDNIRAGLDPLARETVIYFVQSEHGGPIKIGRADDLAKRLVGLQTSRPDKLVVLASAPGTLAQERELHAMFAQARDRGEWFHATEELNDYVKNVAKTRTIVTECDASQNVTGNETSTVTPYRTVPCLAVPPLADDDAPAHPEAAFGGSHVTPIESSTVEFYFGEEYAEAVASRLGGFVLERNEEANVRKAINGFAPSGLSASEVSSRLRLSVTAYIDEREGNAKYEAGFQPRSWLKWLNSGNGHTLSRSADAPSGVHKAAPERFEYAVSDEERKAAANAAMALLDAKAVAS